MGLSCGANCIKILLIIFNVIFFLGGAAILAIGLWLQLDPHSTEILKVLPDEYDPIYKGTVILLIAVGAATFVVGFFGCCGACRESPCMLGTYGTLLIIILIVEIVGGVLAAVFRNRIEAEVKGAMFKQVTNSSVLLYNASQGDATNNAWHAMQISLKCCGANDYKDYAENSNFRSPKPRLPPSCCVTTDNDIENPKFKDVQKCGQLDTDYVNDKGCYNALIDFLGGKSTILIGVAIGIGVLQLLGIILAFCLCNSIRKGEKYE